MFSFQEFRVSGAERGTFGLGSPALLQCFMDLGNSGGPMTTPVQIATRASEAAGGSSTALKS